MVLNFKNFIKKRWNFSLRGMRKTMRCGWKLFRFSLRLKSLGRMNILQCGYIIKVSCYRLPGFGKTLILSSNTNPISITAAPLRPLLPHQKTLPGWVHFAVVHGWDLHFFADLKLFHRRNQRHSKETNYILMSFIIKGDFDSVKECELIWYCQIKWHDQWRLCWKTGLTAGTVLFEIQWHQKLHLTWSLYILRCKRFLHLTGITAFLGYWWLQHDV